MKSIAPILGSALLLAACAAQVRHELPAPTLDLPDGGATVPLRDFGGRPVIDVMIAGQGPFAAIVDTGASGSVIDSDLAEQLKLPKAHGVDTPEAPDGQPVEVVTLTDARIGAAKARDLLAVTEPLSKFMRRPDAPKIVLSAEAFPGYLLSFDFPAHALTLRRGALGKADDRSIFEYAADETLPMVPVRVGKAEKRVHLDTGSPQGLTLPTSYIGQVPVTSEPKLAGIARTHGGEFKVYEASLATPVEVGDVKLALPKMVFSDVRPGGDDGASPPPGNLGSQALGGLVVTIDAANRRVQLKEGAAVP